MRNDQYLALMKRPITSEERKAIIAEAEQWANQRSISGRFSEANRVFLLIRLIHQIAKEPS